MSSIDRLGNEGHRRTSRRVFLQGTLAVGAAALSGGDTPLRTGYFTQWAEGSRKFDFRPMMDKLEQGEAVKLTPETTNGVVAARNIRTVIVSGKGVLVGYRDPLPSAVEYISFDNPHRFRGESLGYKNSLWPTGVVNQITEDKDWIYAAVDRFPPEIDPKETPRGLFTYSKTLRQWTQRLPGSGLPPEVADQTYAISSRDGLTLVGTAKGVVELRENNTWLRDDLTPKLGSRAIHAILDIKGRSTIAVGFRQDYGLLIFPPGDSLQFSEYSERTHPGRISNSIRALALMQDGQTVQIGGDPFYSKLNLKTGNLEADPDLPDNDKNWVLGVTEDSEGGEWVARKDGGWRKQGDQWSQVAGFDKANGVVIVPAGIISDREIAVFATETSGLVLTQV
jgi:hypothetical protein